MIRCAGWLITLYGVAHTLGALTVLGGARHAGVWFSGELWGGDLVDMSPAMSAYWLSVNSFGVPLIVVGLTVLRLDRRRVTPPPVIGWTLGIWTVVKTVMSGPTPPQWLVLLLATILLLVGARRRDRTARRRHTADSLGDACDRGGYRRCESTQW